MCLVMGLVFRYVYMSHVLPFKSKWPSTHHLLGEKSLVHTDSRTLEFISVSSVPAVGVNWRSGFAIEQSGLLRCHCRHC